MDRRAFVTTFAALGATGTALADLLLAQAQEQEQVTKEMLACAEDVLGLEFTDAEREEMLDDLNDNLEDYAGIRDFELENAVAPAIQFDPVLPGTTLPTEQRPIAWTRPARVTRPASLEEVAFWPLTRLAELVRTGQVTPSELTRMYLDRLKRHGDRLEAVITLTEERALVQAARLDSELAAGLYRGPLHGIPWGAKDLLATVGYPTTWGAAPYRDQVIDMDATVVRRLDEAGAILVAKLTLGALAQGDRWYGGRTRNPWNLEQGSSGSSAGSAATTVAGLVGFAIGTETLGSIVSPSTRTGASGLRPTYGRVPRTGAMALSWSMDKIGPICRSIEDCALVLDAIHGPDGQDLTVREVPFLYDGTAALDGLRIGYYASAFEDDEREDRDWLANDRAALDQVRRLAGRELIPVELPTRFPLGALRGTILIAEAAAAFDDLTLSGRDDLMERSSWPNSFRQARTIPAVEYINANRIRTLVMEATRQALSDVDVFITPSYGGVSLLLTNLTGHPEAVVPNGFRADGTPTSIAFISRLYREGEAIRLAKAYQESTGWHERTPPLFS
ncbi:MAG: amidase [Longimicrobiales bacterium]